MTNHQFAIWLATWQYTQRQVADEFGITEQTLSTYKRNENYPKWFVLALRGLETKGVRYEQIHFQIADYYQRI